MNFQLEFRLARFWGFFRLPYWHVVDVIYYMTYALCKLQNMSSYSNDIFVSIFVSKNTTRTSKINPLTFHSYQTLIFNFKIRYVKKWCFNHYLFWKSFVYWIPYSQKVNHSGKLWKSIKLHSIECIMRSQSGLSICWCLLHPSGYTYFLSVL